MSTYFDYIKVGDNLTGATLKFFEATPNDSDEAIIETSTGAKFTYSRGTGIILEGVGTTIRRFDLSETSIFTLPSEVEAGIVTKVNIYSDCYKYIQMEKQGAAPVYGFKNNKCKEDLYTKEEITELLEGKIDSKNATVTDKSGIANIGNLKIKFGCKLDITVPATDSALYNVKFDEAFNTVPCVFVQSRGNYNIKGEVTNCTNASFDINVRSLDGTERTERNFDWIAIGS